MKIRDAVGAMFVTSAMLVFLFAGSVASAQQKKPNIVVIWGDDIGIGETSK